MKKALVPALLALALGAALVIQLGSAGGTLCRVCVDFEGQRQCAEARADTREEAEREAQASACSLVARGVSAAMSCPRLRPLSVDCRE